MRHLVLINPASNRGDTAAVELDIQRAFTSRGLRFEVVRTARAGHARQLVAEHGSEFEGIIAVGGDGTLHEVIQGIDLERHVLGLIPCGSGNDFAWMNGWPADVEACADRIGAARERRVDLGLWDGGRFHSSVGIGLEARVTYESLRIKYLRGAAIYLAAVMRTLSDLRTYPSRIDWGNGHWEGDLLLASVGNGRRVGGAFFMTPDARNDDGQLDICFSPGVSLARLLWILPRTFKGTHTRIKPVPLRRGGRSRIDARGGLPVHIDGEMIGLDVHSLDLRVAPLALRTF
jgi:YegS/Rv2252/BmrU family lipid kinase